MLSLRKTYEMSIRAFKRKMEFPQKHQNKVTKSEMAIKTLKYVIDGTGKLQQTTEEEMPAAAAEKEEKAGNKEWEEPNLCIISDIEISAFFKLLDDSHICNFLKKDSCYKLADKYLLAMVFVYFKRAKYPIYEFTRMNFFVALYLAHYVEEDDEDEKYQILPWAVGDGWRWDSTRFFRKRDQLWTRMGHRAIVSLKTCEEYISFAPNHPVWKRIRSDHHTGAIRYHGRNCVTKPTNLFGPNISPPVCRLCKTKNEKDDDRDSFSSIFSIINNSQFLDNEDNFVKQDGEFQFMFVEE